MRQIALGVISALFIVLFSTPVLADPPEINPLGLEDTTFVGHSVDDAPVAGRIVGPIFDSETSANTLGVSISTDGDDIVLDMQELQGRDNGPDGQIMPDATGNAIDGNAADGPGVDNNFD